MELTFENAWKMAGLPKVKKEITAKEEFDALNKGICPFCGTKLNEGYRMVGGDDYAWYADCPGCGENWDA